LCDAASPPASGPAAGAELPPADDRDASAPSDAALPDAGLPDATPAASAAAPSSG
jgi:hypothetical protein